jgi:hypothetical protein
MGDREDFDVDSTTKIFLDTNDIFNDSKNIQIHEDLK